MAKKSAPKKLDKKERSKFQKALSALKRKGLVSKNVDVRKQAPTKHMLNKIKKHQGVLTGTEQAVKIRLKKGQTLAQAKAEAKAANPQFEIIGDRIIVPARKGEKVKYSAKTGLGSTRRAYGTIWKVRYIQGVGKANIDDLIKYQEKGYSFSIGFRNHKMGSTTYRYWDDPREMMAEMSKYSNYKKWADYIELVEPIGKYRDNEGDAEIGDGQRIEFDEYGNQVFVA